MEMSYPAVYDDNDWAQFADMRSQMDDGCEWSSTSGSVDAPLSPRTSSIIDNFVDYSTPEPQNQHYPPSTISPCSDAIPSVYSQNTNSPDSAYNDTQESDDNPSNVSSPEYHPQASRGPDRKIHNFFTQGRQMRPRIVKKPYQPPTEGRKRGRPLKDDEGPSDVLQKRHYARNYREKQKHSQSILEDAAIELYLCYTKGIPMNSNSMKYLHDLAEKRQKASN